VIGDETLGMGATVIADQRLLNSRLFATPFENPEEVVHWLAAMQSQDFAGAKWAIAQRTKNVVTDVDISLLFNKGKILRTHTLRPTWHFLMPKDIRWILKLTGPRVNVANAYYYRKFKLDEAIFAKCNIALINAMHGGVQLTRAEISQVYKNVGINASGLRLAYLIMRAELDAVICSGAMRGKQSTYALLEERVSKTKMPDHDAALAELTKRYFTSHGPAQIKDFTWWSGLTATEAKVGIEINSLEHETIDGKTYWYPPGQPTRKKLKAPLVHLLPNYDEYLIAYKDHSHIFDAILLRENPITDTLMAHIIILNGQVIGGWRRTVQKNEIIIKTNLLVRLDNTEQSALKLAAEHYSQFMGMPVALL
jgi:hypothetical protein